jgi:multiple sugar transport system permease protein
VTARSRWRALGFAGVVLAALATLGAARWASARYERGLAQRAAATTAAYLSLVTPAAKSGAGYELPRLLIESYAVGELAELTSRVEVYHRTAPLVHATAPALPHAVFERLRRQAAPQWHAGAVLAPLFDRDGWDVVGAIAVWPRAGAGPSIGTLLALLVALAAGAMAVGAVGSGPVLQGERGKWRGWSGRSPAWYGAAAVLLGIAAYRDVRAVATDSTDRWLVDTRLLMQEAMARVPDARSSVAILAPITREAEVGLGDSAGPEAWRRQVGGMRRAAVAVRLAPGRWAELRVVPAEAGAGGWLVVTLGLALLGPCVAAFAAWGSRMAGQPQRRRETLTAWGFLAPSALHLAVFSFAPILFAFYLALHRWSLVEPVRPFVGVVNFTRMLHDPLVWIALRNTVLYVLYVPVSAGVALAVALALRRSTRGTRAVRAMFFLPSVSSVVAIALVWQWMYHADFGLVNYLLSFVHVPPVDWLGNPKTALLAVMVASVWVQLGYQMTVFLTGLNGIPEIYLDAARVDGANAWQRFRRITLPLLRPVTLFVLVTGIIGSFQVFTYVYVLTDGGPLHTTDVIVYRIYQAAWGFLRFGYASALAVLLFVVLSGLTRVQFKLLGRQVEYG